MKLLGKIEINIQGTSDEVILSFLRVYLANKRLTDKQLHVTAQLVTHYAQYIADGVIEPYASTLLFSTEVRKEICDTLNISAAHLNNTFNALTKKDILAKEATYSINPNLVPKETLTFKFKIGHASKG